VYRRVWPHYKIVTRMLQECYKGVPRVCNIPSLVANIATVVANPPDSAVSETRTWEDERGGRGEGVRVQNTHTHTRTHT
jgi:hypothetical protein